MKQYLKKKKKKIKKKQEMEKPLLECDTIFLIWTTIFVYFYGGITSISV